MTRASVLVVVCLVSCSKAESPRQVDAGPAPPSYLEIKHEEANGVLRILGVLLDDSRSSVATSGVGTWAIEQGSTTLCQGTVHLSPAVFREREGVLVGEMGLTDISACNLKRRKDWPAEANIALAVTVGGKELRASQTIPWRADR